MINKSNIIKFIIRLLIASGLMFYFLYTTDLLLIWNSIHNIHLKTILFILLLNLIAILIGVYKWLLITNVKKYRILLEISLISRLYAFILPGQIAGEIAKSYYLSKSQNDTSDSIVSVVIDKLSGILAIFIVGLFGVLCSETILSKTLIPPFIIGIILLLVLIIFVHPSFQYLSRFIGKTIQKIQVKSLQNLGRKLETIAMADFSIRKNSGRIILNILLSIIYQTVSITIVYLLSTELKINVSYFDYCWIFGIIVILMLAPVSIAGIGVREGSFIGLLALVGVSKHLALALSISFFSLQIFDAILGFFAILSRFFLLKKITFNF